MKSNIYIIPFFIVLALLLSTSLFAQDRDSLFFIAEPDIELPDHAGITPYSIQFQKEPIDDLQSNKEKKSREERTRDDYRHNVNFYLISPAVDYFHASMNYMFRYNKNYFSIGTSGLFNYAGLWYRYGYNVYDLNKYFSIIPMVGLFHQTANDNDPYEEYPKWFLSVMTGIDYIDPRNGLNFQIGYSFSFNFEQTNHIPTFALGWYF